MKAFLFPGQGSQKVGMGKDLIEEYTFADEAYREADEVLGFSISNISFEGPEEEMAKTRNSQLSILIYSYIADMILKNEKKIFPDFLAGHSLGEFSAILSSGMLSFKEMLKVVNKRGELMMNADPDSKGGMTAVLGLDDSVIKSICREVAKDKYVEPVNYNSPGQVVISGLKEGLDIAETRLKEAGAKRVLRLNVSGAFHSRLMENASDEFAVFLKDIDFKKPKYKIVGNVTAGFLDEKNVKELLAGQMKNPVLWTDSVIFLRSLGVNRAVEVGFGNVISGLIKKIDSGIEINSWNQLI